MTRGLAIGLEVELLVAQGPAQFGEGGLGVVVGIAVLQQLVNLRQPPPSAFASLGLAAGIMGTVQSLCPTQIGDGLNVLIRVGQLE